MVASEGLQVGPIELEARVGRGAMGEVWRGRHRVTGREVAVKLLRASGAWGASLREEARAVAGLTHRHVIGVYDLGEVSSGVLAGQTYLVMEYARLGSLASWRGRLAWPSLQVWVYQMLRGLSHISARGLVHLDIKPPNLLLAEDAPGEAALRISDFGLGRALGERAVVAGGGAGTPGYMAPEQREGRWGDVGAWTDLYAAGMTVWELMGGPRLGWGAAPWALPGFPQELSAWVARCVEAAPEARFGSAAEALAALEAACGPAPERAGLPGAAIAADCASFIVENGNELTVSAVWTGATAPVLEALPLPVLAAAPLATAPLPRRAVEVPPSVGALEEPGARLFAGVGLGLYALREPPLVGREAERGQLWGALVEASSGRPQAVVVSGEPGAGRTRLARWLMEASRERADALGVDAREQPGQGSLALGWLVEGLLGAQQARTQEGLRACAGRVAPQLTPGQVREGWALIAEARSGGRRPRFTRPEERQEAACRLLGALGASRRVVIVVDEAPRSPALVELARRVLAAGQGAVLFVLTAVDGASWGGLEGAAAVALAPLGSGEVVELVRQHLGVSSALAEEVAARVGGNPLFAVQQLRGWIERGVLAPSSSGLTLVAPELPRVPAGLYALWSARLEQLCEGVPAAEVRGLAVAALLGAQCSAALLEASCAEAGAAVPAQLGERLDRAGLLERGQGRWRLTSAALRETCARLASPEEAPRLHEACARALTRCVKAPWPTPVLLALAEHRLGAADPEGALLALRGLIDAGMDASVAQACGALVERCALALPSPEAEGWRRALSARAWFLQGDLERASAALGTPALEASGCSPELAIATLGIQQLIAFSRGQVDEAKTCAEAMQQQAARGGEEALSFRAELAAGRAWLLAREGARSIPVLQQALRREAPSISPMMRMVAQNLLGVAQMESGQLEDAVETLNALFAAAEQEGASALQGHVCNALGDAALRRQRWEEARGWLEQAVELSGERYPAAAYMRGNLALVFLRQGDAAAAQEEAAQALERLGHGARHLPWLYLHEVLQGALAWLGHGARWDDLLERLEEALPGFQTAHPEGAELAEEGAARWAARGDASRARRSWALAAALWSRVGEPARAAAAAACAAR